MKKQITIDGQYSDWYEKAIFILKDDDKKNVPDNLVLHAEHIIENYLKRNPSTGTCHTDNKKRKSKKKTSQMARNIDRFFNISLLICAVSILVLVIVLYF